MYKTLGFRWLNEVFCPASAFATADSDEARNPQRFIHVPLASIKMKTTILILLLGVVIYSHGQVLDSNYLWIATESRHLKNNVGIWPMDGMAFEFDNEQLSMSHVFFDTIQFYPLEIKKRRIFLNDTLWGKVRHLDKDSLLIDFEKTMRVKFIPLSNGEFTKDDLDYWKCNNWTFSNSGYLQEFKLLDSLWGLYPNDMSKICVTQSLEKRYRYSHIEKWNIKEINGRHLFTITKGQFDPEIYNVLEYKGDTVLLESLTHQDSALIMLVKDPIATPKEKDRIIHTIQNQRWYSTALIDKANSFEDDTLYSEFMRSGFFVIDTLLFKRTSLLNNQLSFEFSDDYEYGIYESDTLRIDGKWRLSETGKQIIINKGFSPNDYIDLYHVNADSIVIGKSDMFQVGKRKTEYIDYYYKMTLTK